MWLTSQRRRRQHPKCFVFPPLHAASLWGYQRTARQQRESQRSADNRRKLFGSCFDTLFLLLFRYAMLLSRLVEETCFGPVSEHLRRRSDGISGSFRKLGFIFQCPLPVKHTPEKKKILVESCPSPLSWFLSGTLLRSLSSSPYAKGRSRANLVGGDSFQWLLSAIFSR